MSGKSSADATSEAETAGSRENNGGREINRGPQKLRKRLLRAGSDEADTQITG
jgi:hypothetical protein